MESTDGVWNQGDYAGGGVRPVGDGVFAQCLPAARRVASVVLNSPTDAEKVALDACRAVVVKLRSGTPVEDPMSFVARTAWRLARARTRAAATRDVGRTAGSRRASPTSAWEQHYDGPGARALQVAQTNGGTWRSGLEIRFLP